MKTNLFAIVLASFSLVAACSSSSTPSTPTGSSGTASSSSGSSGDTEEDSGTPAPETHDVQVKSNLFVPNTLTIKVGETVTWTWAGGSHDVVSGANCTSDKGFSSDLISTTGATFKHTFDKAGKFEYFCTPHCVSAGMKATITVEE